MPDAAQAIPFWTSVANTFKGNAAVIFDLFNEPYPELADPDHNLAASWHSYNFAGGAPTALRLGGWR
jgi:endoglucanase